MPRVKTWHRNQLQDLNVHQVGSLSGALFAPAGSTLLRLHYSFMFHTHQDPPLGGLPPAQIVLGAILLDGSPIPNVPDPLVDTSDNWLWYEGVSVVSSQHTVVAGTYATMQNDPGDSNRDVKAERLFQHDNPVLCFTWNQQPNALFTPLYAFQVTYSALVDQ